jgi:hypothetical protein
VLRSSEINWMISMDGSREAVNQGKVDHGIG